jgi:hypothetical protein
MEDVANVARHMFTSFRDTEVGMTRKNYYRPPPSSANLREVSRPAPLHGP